ncbi:UNVERIFIED_CONTAM: hypothetical protein GTU68_020210 [Idotea baltica]|nr:hypothetical protein [Idotea baltica]
MTKIEITVEPIELFKLLKFANYASGGSEAKAVISDGQVKVNGVTETKKRKKIKVGDIVEFDGLEIQVVMKSAS